MKEIDFLPEWYRSGRRRQISYRTQYVALGGVFVVMLVWNFVAGYSVSTAKEEFSRLESQAVDAKSVSEEFVRIKGEIAKLQKKVEFIEEIDSKIDVASVLAELSFLIDERIVLSKVEFVAEKFSDEKGGRGKSSSVVRMAKSGSESKESLPLGDVRFKVVISGVAADAGGVAELICKLEDSAYFCQVIPSFSRNRDMKAVGRAEENPKARKGIWGPLPGSENYQVSEFEIGCYLANYRER